MYIFVKGQIKSTHIINNCVVFVNSFLSGDMLMSKNNLGEKIKQAVKKTGLTQSEFEKKFDISENLVSRWIKGDRNPSIKSLKKISKATEIPLNFFLDNSLSEFKYTKDQNLNIEKKIDLILEKIKIIEKFIENKG